jgi:kynurenine formamidase
MTDLPRFDDLPLLDELGLRHAWGVFGDDDRLGTVNLLTPDRVAAAAAGVRTGEVISLDLPLDLPDPPLFGRQAYEHHVFALNRNEMDDRLDGFHLQGSTQWDALSHVRCRQFGYWGGRADDPTSRHNDLGIEHVAEHGLAGRGVLVDVEGWARRQGRPFDPLEPHAITAADLDAALAEQGTALEVGDILCVRTGWCSAYRALEPSARPGYAESPSFAGLRADEDTARLLWDAHVAALVCDNPAVEVVPGDPAVGSLHRRLIPLLGFTLGEMFDLERLARRCAELRRWTFLLVAAPLKVPGGVGSPGNAVAIL